jgi:hypothetical protein
MTLSVSYIINDYLIYLSILFNNLVNPENLVNPVKIINRSRKTHAGGYTLAAG